MVNGRATEGLLGIVFSKTLIIGGFLFGLLFAWIGYIVFIFSFPPASTDITGFKVALFLNSLGFASICMFLIGGGIANKDIDKFIRMIMIIGGIIVLIMTIVLSISSLITMSTPYTW